LEQASEKSTGTLETETEIMSEVNSNSNNFIPSDAHSNFKELERKSKKRSWKKNFMKLCLFCDHESEDTEQNLIHMFHEHAFHFPFADEVKRPTDLLF